MSTAQTRAIEDYNRLIHRNAVSHAIRAAVHLGILKALEEGQLTLEQLATKLELNSRPLQLLMNVLVQTELVEKYDDDYALSAVARLIPSQSHDLGDRYWQYLAGVVRHGVLLPADDEVPVRERDYLIDAAASEWTCTPVALDVADALEIGTKRKQLRLLELGCGAAVFGAAIAHRDPTTHIVLVDEAESLKRARKTVEGVELQSRAQFIEADYADPQFVEQFDNAQFDLVLVAGILNRHSVEDVEAMLERFRDLVKVDGEIAIVDIFPGQDEGAQHRAVHELELFLRTKTGTHQNPKGLEESLVKLGFTDIQYAHLPSSPKVWGLIVARRT